MKLVIIPVEAKNEVRNVIYNSDYNSEDFYNKVYSAELLYSYYIGVNLKF
jgi:hypothetical protein